MKYMFAALLSLLFVPAAFADTPVVRWDSIVGVITSPGVDNPVADIHGGATPWTTTRGQATINLENGGTASSSRDSSSTVARPPGRRGRSAA